MNPTHHFHLALTVVVLAYVVTLFGPVVGNNPAKSALSSWQASNKNTSAVTAVAPSRSLPSQQASPPEKVIAPGACPFEGCQYGKWTAREDVAVYSRPDGPVLKWNIRRGNTVTAESGEVWAAPHKATVTKIYKTDVEQGIDVGNVIYPLYPLGEGAVAVWHGGRVKEGSLDLEFRYDQPLESLNWTWWVRVGLADGNTGWVKNPQSHFDGMDRFS